MVAHIITEVAENVAMVVVFEHDLPTFIGVVPPFQLPIGERKCIGYFEVECQRDALHFVRSMGKTLDASDAAWLGAAVGRSLSFDDAGSRCGQPRRLEAILLFRIPLEIVLAAPHVVQEELHL